ncbi:MAG: aminotransferase class V-fold PLP-dependent enzyme [Actinomycetota bacterium]
MAIYFDNAATTFPKPPGMSAAMAGFQDTAAANPGRSGHHMSVEAGRVLYDARDRLASLLGIADPLDIAFTLNATMALNIALRGYLKSGDHVVTTSMEHNSVARPLRWAESMGVGLSVVPADPKTGEVDPADIIKAINPSTTMVAMTHASNVTGTIMPVAEVGAATRKRGVALLVDAAQTAGAIPIDVEAMSLDLLAYTGHKSLFGPMGTGGLYVRPGLELSPLLRGGTGSRSEEDTQPDFMPDRLESGTPNTVGAAGLTAGLQFIATTGLAEIERHKKALAGRFLDGLAGIKDVAVYGQPADAARLPVVAFNIVGFECSKVADRLDKDYGILVRAGLQCSPWAHQTIDTYPAGAVRFSFGYFNTLDEIDAAIAAIKEIAGAG